MARTASIARFQFGSSVALVAVYFGFTYLGMLDLRGTPLSLSTGLFCLLLAPEFYAPMRRLAAHYHDRANALAAVAELHREVNRAEAVIVRRARMSGASWAQIARLLGVSRQAVHKKYAKRVQPGLAPTRRR